MSETNYSHLPVKNQEKHPDASVADEGVNTMEYLAPQKITIGIYAGGDVMVSAESFNLRQPWSYEWIQAR